MILAEKIASLRKKSGWSQEELAERLGISRQSVSKWEGGTSIPDIDKIIAMSRLFGVSTDYLLKDEISESVPAKVHEVEEETACGISLEEANAFMKLTRQLAGKLALGTALCVLCPVPLILLAGLAEYGGLAISEDRAGGIGAAILLIMVAAGVAILILSGMKLGKYDFLETEEITLQYGVKGLVEKRKEEFSGVFRVCVTVGVVLCIIGAVPIMLAAAREVEDLTAVCSVDILLVLVSVAVFLFVWAGSIQNSFNKLLQVEEFTAEQKAVKKRTSFFAGAYWCLVTAVFLAIGFYGKTGWNGEGTDGWKSAWIIWPVAGVLFAAVSAILNAVVRSRLDKKGDAGR